MIIGGKNNEEISLDATIENLDACSRCKGGCCKGKDKVIPLSDKESSNIPDYLVTSLDNIPIMKRSDKRCIALNDRGCSIFDVRPFYCRIYPIKLVSVVESIGYCCYVTGYALVLNKCRLGESIDFELEVEKIVRELKKSPELFERMKKATDKYDRVKMTYLSQDYPVFRMIE